VSNQADNLAINLAFLPTKPTGLATYALNLLPHLRPLAPTLLAAEPREGFRHAPVPANLTNEQGRQGHFSRLKWTQFELPAVLRSLEPALLFCPIPETPLYCNQRAVVTVHDLIPLRFFRLLSPLRLYQRYYLPQVLHQAAHIICNSRSTAQDVMGFFQIPAAKITPILLAHDATNFRFLDLPTSNYFLYLGRNDPYKNLQRVVAAFAQLRDRADCELWIVGPMDPRYVDQLTAQIRELGIADQVKFPGYLPYEKLPVVMNQAIALVVPSLWEGFGLPILEAMACGTPVITSQVSSLPEVAGDAALLVNPYDVGAIAHAMQRILTEPALATQLRQASLARAQHFSWQQTGQATVEVLQRYLN
jgi:glycosyltransferase involved in cell wall biosynthesis